MSAVGEKRFSDNKTFWVKELSEFLEGRMNEFHRKTICVGDPKYEVVKQRMIEQVGRIKAGVKFMKVNDFDKVRMGKMCMFIELKHWRERSLGTMALTK